MVIKKFENYENNKFQTEVEELLLNESYELMGKDDEEAMRILDTLISKYDTSENTVLPETIQTSILNAIELAIISNNDDTRYKELANKYMSKSPDTKPLIGMLDIIRNAQDLDQDEALSQWKEEYADYHFPDWSFQELRAWMMKIEDKGTKERVSKYLDAFERHKYNVNTKDIIYETPSNSSSKDSSESDYDNREIIYEAPSYDAENPIYYKNPYINDSNQEYQDDTVHTDSELY